MIVIQNVKEINELKIIKTAHEELRPNLYKEDVHSILALNKGGINMNVVDEKFYYIEQFIFKPFEIYSMIPAFIIKCIAGSVDVFIKDKRNCSNTSQNEYTTSLSALDHKAIYIPEACCYALFSKSDNTVVSIKANQITNNSNVRIVSNSEIGFNFAPYFNKSKLDKSYLELFNS
jgi:hypothetical protein